MQISTISKLCKSGTIHGCIPYGEQSQFSYLFAVLVVVAQAWRSHPPDVHAAAEPDRSHGYGWCLCLSARTDPRRGIARVLQAELVHERLHPPLLLQVVI